MTRTRTDYAMPCGVDLLSLQCWAEWRRQRVSINELARRAGYERRTIAKLLFGAPMFRRRLVAADVWEVLKSL